MNMGAAALAMAAITLAHLEIDMDRPAAPDPVWWREMKAK
jgi:hypothetical protein